MKKKIAVYATGAIVLGMVAMVLPLTLKPSPFAPMGWYSSVSPFSRLDGSGEAAPSILSVVTQPANLLSLGGILSSGLVVALCVYIAMKRRTG